MARYREAQPHPGPTLARPDVGCIVEFDPAAMIFQNAADDCQPKAGALLARRHIGFEQARPAYLRQADTVVDDVDHDFIIFARGDDINTTLPQFFRRDGLDGFRVTHTTHVSEISRDVADLASQARSPYHQYPDGLLLFVGTMFAPVADRGAPGSGFTHKTGDVVRIAARELGALVNEVVTCDQAEPWSFGTGALMSNLARRGLL